MLAMGFLVAGITYLDRVCISVAAPAMMTDLGLTNLQMSYVFSVFAAAYGLFEIPTGWLGDRWGQRKMLTRIVVCWSVFTALTGYVRNFASLIFTRFVFGAAEAGAFPTLARALARWFPVTDRGKVNGIMWMGARLGGSAAPPLATLVMLAVGWRYTFVVFGLVGLVWCVVFWFWYRDDPAKHSSVNEAELAYIRGYAAAAEARHSDPPKTTPWKRMLLNGNLWALFWMYFATSYGFWFFLTWLPTYLVKEQGLSARASGYYAALPLFVGAVACLSGGALSDWIVRRTGSLSWGRRAVGMGGFLFTAVGFGAASVAEGPVAAVICLAFAAGAMDLAVPVAWAACLEVGGKFGGTATGFMNTASSISAFISPIAAAWLFERYGSFSAMFASAAAVYLLAGLLWFKIDAGQTLQE
ncbi:MAG: MFS transporter [Bryobacteraceae bacterium]|nr:MFS transporter [Bryobacteraceae bacterium]